MGQSQAWGLAMDMGGDRHLAALGLSGAELKRLCLEGPEMGPCPRSRAPSRRAVRRRRHSAAVPGGQRWAAGNS